VYQFPEGLFHLERSASTPIPDFISLTLSHFYLPPCSDGKFFPRDLISISTKNFYSDIKLPVRKHITEEEFLKRVRSLVHI
jgi:hypothetical protein